MLKTTEPIQTGKLLLSEEALVSEVGHFFEYTRSVVEIAAGQGITSFVAVHKDANATVIDTLPAYPVYPRTSWGTINILNNPLVRHSKTIAHNLQIYRTMSKLLDEVGPVDVVFAPTVTIHHLLGFYLLARRKLGKDFSRLVILTRNTIASYIPDDPTPKFKKQAVIFAKLIQRLSAKYTEEQFTFATDSERLADEYEVLCGIRPKVFPSPRIAPPRIVNTPRGDTVTYSSLGPARFEKGIDILEDAVERYAVEANEDDPARFVIQWNQPLYHGDALVEPKLALKENPKVRFITDELSSEEYDAELYGADCLIVPYRRESYFARISGVAVEAVTAGIPVIYTTNTWCEDLVTKSGAGIGVPDGDPEALANAMRIMTRDIEKYSDAAKKAAQKARDENSAEAFAELLFGDAVFASTHG